MLALELDVPAIVVSLIFLIAGPVKLLPVNPVQLLDTGLANPSILILPSPPSDPSESALVFTTPKIETLYD